MAPESMIHGALSFRVFAEVQTERPFAMRLINIRIIVVNIHLIKRVSSYSFISSLLMRMFCPASGLRVPPLVTLGKDWHLTIFVVAHSIVEKDRIFECSC